MACVQASPTDVFRHVRGHLMTRPAAAATLSVNAKILTQGEGGAGTSTKLMTAYHQELVQVLATCK